MIIQGALIVIFCNWGTSSPILECDEINPVFLSHIATVLDGCFSENARQMTVSMEQTAPPSVSRALLQQLHRRCDTAVQVVHGEQPEPLPWRELVQVVLTFVKSDSFIVLVSNCSSTSLDRSLCHLSKHNSWNPRGRFLIVVTDIVSGDAASNVQFMFHTLWQYKILNVMIVIMEQNETSQHARLFTYNPFTYEFGMDVTTNLLNYNLKHVCYNPVLDLNRTIVKVSMFEATPNSIPIGNTSSFKGTDVQMMNTILAHMNAKPKVIMADKYTYGVRLDNGTLLGSSGDAAYGRADISFVSRIIKLDRLDLLDYSYPHDQNDFVIAVPKAGRIPQYQNLFLPFDHMTWLCLILSIPITALGWYFVYRCSVLHSAQLVKNRSITAVCLETFQMFLSVSVETLPQLHSERLVVFFWLYFSLVTTSCFQGSLTSYLAVAKYLPDINTFEQLYSSGLRLQTHPASLKYIQHKYIDDKISKMSDRVVSWDLEKYYFYDVSHSRNVSALAPKLMMQYEILKKTSFRHGQPLLHMMNDKLLMAYSYFELPRHSPYLPRINTLMGRVSQTGLYKKWMWDIIYKGFANHELIHAKTDQTDNEPLTVLHLQTAFYILTLGLIFSSIAFIVEHLYRIAA